MSRFLFLHLILFLTISIIPFVSSTATNHKLHVVSHKLHKLHVVSHGRLKTNNKFGILGLAVAEKVHKFGHDRGLSIKFLAAHNTVRILNHLSPLKWNRTLARYARHWAAERSGDCQLQHSNSPYGENMFWSKNGHWTPLEVVKAWSSEFKFYNAATNECVGNNACGHYTQIIWKKTTQIGCGRAQCTGNKGFIYVCSYDPPGNYYFEGPLGGHFTKSIVYPPPPGRP